MTTAYQTGPGFFAAGTNKTDKSVAPDMMRVYCVRLEAYDLAKSEEAMDDIQFEIIFAKAEKDKRLALALIQLGKAIQANSKLLRRIAEA